MFIHVCTCNGLTCKQVVRTWDPTQINLALPKEVPKDGDGRSRRKALSTSKRNSFYHIPYLEAGVL